MTKLWILQFRDDGCLINDILHKLDDGRTTYNYRKGLAEKVVKFLNERNEAKNLFCEKEQK